VRVGVTQDGADALRSLVSWWQLAGVDVTVDDSPRQWLRAAAAPPIAPSEARPDLVSDTLPITLEALVSWLSSAETFPALGADRPVPAGAVSGGLMLLTDMPDVEDASAGTLVAGTAGRLLDAMLGAIGRDRPSVYLASLAPGRPATGRIDATLEQELGRIARHHIALVRPRAVLMLGDATTRALTGVNLAQARGSIHPVNLDGGTVPSIATFHPRFLLQQPARKADAWADLRMLVEILNA
jgi:DNA polymerase